MGKVKWAIGADEPDDLETFDVYDGEVPPKGVYKCKLKFIKVKTNRNDDDMLNGLLIIDETGDKKKYNGYGVWFNQNVTDQGAPYIKQMLRAFGLTWKDFTSKTITDDDTDPPTIKKIGNLKLDSEPEVRILGKRESYQGETKLSVATWLPPRDEDDDDDDGDDGADDSSTDDSGDEPPF